MYYIPRLHITIGDAQFVRAQEVVVEKSSDILEDTAVIKIPATARLLQSNKAITVRTAQQFKVGDKVSILLSYKGVFKKVEFQGYVKKINPTQPLEIECEDATWLLRRKNVNKSWKSTTLKDVLQEIVKGTGVELSADVPPITFSPFYIQNSDAAFALQKLKDEYGLAVYFQEDGKLYAGLAYTQSTGTVKYALNGKYVNVIDANSLKWHTKDDVKIKIKAVSIHQDNTRTEVEFGDKDGALRTIHLYNVKNKSELEKLAKKELERVKFDGYKGDIKTFLIPEAIPGMEAIIEDVNFPERSGVYYVESVKTTFNTSGVRRTVKLGIQL